MLIFDLNYKKFVFKKKLIQKIKIIFYKKLNSNY